MPTIIRERGFRVVIYTHDHDPPHVHVHKAGTEARVLLDPLQLWDSDMKPNDTKQALEIVSENRDILLERWQEIHGTEDDNGIDSE